MDRSCTAAEELRRRRWVVAGCVQGIGFRPFVYRLAKQCGLTGSVRNDSQGVVIEIQGCSQSLSLFQKSFAAALPPLAQVASIIEADCQPNIAETQFSIEQSVSGDAPTAGIAPDIALCEACRAEMRDPANRRFGHALISCTNCGPRFSIVRSIPYDRPATTMASFELCGQCAQEYINPDDRRFHAQPVSCLACGPQIEFMDNAGRIVPGDPVATAAHWLLEGRIIAIKGIGGFHLAARADQPLVVHRLRQLKQRDAKPMAVMVCDEAEAGKLIDLSDNGIAALTSPAAPIVLATRRSRTPIAPQVAAGTHRLGVMLAYTPLQHLLFDRLGNIPLVMTSGNISDEPIAINNQEAFTRLGPLCDGFLWHDRPIQRCVDDSVVLDAGPGREIMPVRRSRGYVPATIELGGPKGCMGIALGGELKNTLCAITDAGAVLSAHLGDLRHQKAFMNFKSAVDDLLQLYDVKPAFVACDAHPMYVSSHYAVELARRYGARLISVQHHHAHACSVLAEHNHWQEALALVCDGTGLGSDGGGWGGELLRVSPQSFTRLGSIAPLQLPGGDAAAVDIRRSALAILWRLYGVDASTHPITRRLFPESAERNMLCTMLRHNVQSVLSSSIGRLYDGLAALLGVCTHNRFEAQAAMALEAIAYRHVPTQGLEPMWKITPWHQESERSRRQESQRLDLDLFWHYAIELLVQGAAPDRLAAEFHWQLAMGLASLVKQQAAETGLSTVVLAGGVFVNEILRDLVIENLEDCGLKVLRNCAVPCNDGGLALGQAFVAVHDPSLAGCCKPAEQECALCA
ncbi:MAG: carbamoyltransferase HypF [Phycisphaerae bacterium]